MRPPAELGSRLGHPVTVVAVELDLVSGWSLRMETIPLRDAIRVLRSEILAARKGASTEEVKFELGPIEMEYQVVAA